MLSNLSEQLLNKISVLNFQKSLKVKAPSIAGSRKKELLLFESHAGLRFRKLDFLNLAFCHRSYANESHEDVDNNEKLEFLGDSVLGLITSEYLFYLLPDKAEGDLARIKSFVVSENSLNIIAKSIKVDNFILIGKGEEYSGGRNKKALLADCLEAIIGAYLPILIFQQNLNFLMGHPCNLSHIIIHQHPKAHLLQILAFFPAICILV